MIVYAGFLYLSYSWLIEVGPPPIAAGVSDMWSKPRMESITGYRARLVTSVLCLTAALYCTSTALAAGDVWVVDKSGSGDFQNLRVAVNQAA